VPAVKQGCIAWRAQAPDVQAVGEVAAASVPSGARGQRSLGNRLPWRRPPVAPRAKALRRRDVRTTADQFAAGSREVTGRRNQPTPAPAALPQRGYARIRPQVDGSTERAASRYGQRTLCWQQQLLIVQANSEMPPSARRLCISAAARSASAAIRRSGQSALNRGATNGAVTTFAQASSARRSSKKLIVHLPLKLRRRDDCRRTIQAYSRYGNL